MTAALCAWALLAAGFSTLTAAKVLLARRRSVGGEPAAWPQVILLRPIDAPRPRELANLSAPIDYPGALTQVVLSPYRPRLPPGVKWLYSDPTSANRKVGHLVYALEVLEGAGDSVVLAIDADVEVDGALVRGLVGPLLAGAALSTAAPAPARSDATAARFVRGLLAHSHHSFVALDAMSAGAKSLCGKAIGLGPAARTELPTLLDHLGEDLELGKKLHARGERVELSTIPARMPEPPPSLREPLERFTRWMLVLRAHRPGLYPTVPLLFAPSLPLLVAALASSSAPLAVSVACLFAARATLSLVLAPGRHASTDWLLGETLLLAAFVRSLGARTVTWRGRTFALHRGGKIAPIASAAHGRFG